MEKEIVITVKCGACEYGNILVTVVILTTNSEIIAYPAHKLEQCGLCYRFYAVEKIDESSTIGGCFK